MTSRYFAASLLVSVALLGGCASAPPNLTQTNRIPLLVENNLTPAVGVNVFAINESGVRRRVAYVGPARTMELSVDGSGVVRQYIFQAEIEASPPAATAPNAAGFGAGGPRPAEAPPGSTSREVVSERVDVAVGRGIAWDLNSNLLTPIGDEESD